MRVPVRVSNRARGARTLDTDARYGKGAGRLDWPMR
jgi:hypothetical protein